MKCHNCPINEQTADGVLVGQCCFYLEDGKTCPRHGDVEVEVKRYEETGGHTTRENIWRERVSKPLLGINYKVLITFSHSQN